MTVAEMLVHDSAEMKAVIDVIWKTSNASGNAKREVLRANQGNALLKSVLKAIYDPSITYGVTSIGGVLVDMDWPAGAPTRTWSDAQHVLTKLAHRELSGSAAQQALVRLFEGLTQSERYILLRVIDRDAKMGIGRNSVKKVWPDIFPKFEVMLAKPFEPKRFKGQHFTQVKKDGVRVLAEVARGPSGSFIDGEVSFYSRTGKEFTTFNHLEDELREWLGSFANDTPGLSHHLEEDLIFDGEVTSGNFNDTVGSVRRKSEQATEAEFHIFDMLPASQFYAGKSRHILRQRKDILEGMGTFLKGMTKLVIMPTYIANSVEEIQAMYQKARDNGHEGLMVKDPNAVYECKRSFAWLKMKGEITEDLPITGAYPGEPGTKYAHCLGGVICDRGGVEVRVGGGISDKQREEWWAAYLRDKEKLDTLGTKPGEVGELLGRIAEVEAHEETVDKSLRHPRFVKFRDTFTGSKE